ncbi:MAG: 2-amino-4-hydroxy-6-hydroxymethyldihydropteridine diphosphokinase [Saprospiraceae bacterium]
MIGDNIHLLLGTNLGDRLSNLSTAKKYISELIGSIELQSSIYDTEPFGELPQDSYLNQVIALKTILKPMEVLNKIHLIEERMGRKRLLKNAPRTIDIDILLWDSLILKENSLEIPHPRLHLRNFVLIPLIEISPDFVHPVFNLSIEELYDRCEDELEIVLLDDN